MRRILIAAAGAAALSVAACGERADLDIAAGTGASPQLPAPKKTLLPTLNIAPAKGWPAGGAPKAAEGLVVKAFADKLDHPRWIHVLPNGDVLVAETNAPPKPEDQKGLRAKIQGMVMKRAGAVTKSANRITLLRDTDGDGVADLRSTFIAGLNSPFGMVLVGDRFYVADTDAVLAFPYKEGETTITAPRQRVTDLPAGPRNHHWTKTLIASPDGQHLYATVGSNSNVAENGMAEEEGRAAIWEIDVATGAKRLFATGLRNPNGMGWEPSSGALWTVVNERDEIGSDLVPDYMTSVRDGGFYGWPYSYYGQHVDERVKPPRPDLVARAIKPDYALGPHTASLGLTFDAGSALPAPFKGGAFIGQHGSWNRKPHSGYKVIFVPFAGGKPSGPPLDVLTGFLNGEGEALGRPVGVAFDRRGALLAADDVGNVIWRVSKR
ncbi:sorbosone dehydrogenase [Caulobacter flavus]|uniref:Sorbosone dehydrogenase n=1 Tax=Caulobacter flavus TaxID=1679497 RepID=A0A2N5CUW8_9CAUL|nr:sorbosone dehydrogenase family protein [Caulobacter flavus]AYV45369.1 sorbosone dehydrogenase [Caulobacter flavus]PLR17599.1 sorbosone dehydrogenase [Caulobacter flavus]